MAVSIMKGSSKFPSLLGIQSCSIYYWVFELGTFLMAWYFYKRNMHLLRVWTSPNITLG
jgi:hypothetical protein